MQSLLDRAADVFARHPSAALPLDELRHQVRGSGVAVGGDALLRALRSGPGRFRVLDPFRGPWRALADPLAGAARVGEGGSGTHRGRGRTGVRGAVESPLPGVGRLWVVARPGRDRWSPGPGAAGLRRMRRTVAHLGWSVDERSPRETARWCRLVREAERFRLRARRRAAGGGSGSGTGRLPRA